MLATAIGNARAFVVNGHPVSAAHVWAVGAAIFFRSDPAGVVSEFSIATLARDCHMENGPSAPP